MLRVAFDTGISSARIEGKLEWDLPNLEREARAVAVLVGSRRVRMRGHGDRRWVIAADRAEAVFEPLPGVGAWCFGFDASRVEADRGGFWRAAARRIGRWLGFSVGALEWHVVVRLERFGRKDLEHTEPVPEHVPARSAAA